MGNVGPVDGHLEAKRRAGGTAELREHSGVGGASHDAAATLDEVRKAMRIDYFENDNLLK